MDVPTVSFVSIVSCNFLHGDLDVLGDIANIANFASAFFSSFLRSLLLPLIANRQPLTLKSLVIPYTFLNHSLIITLLVLYCPLGVYLYRTCIVSMYLFHPACIFSLLRLFPFMLQKEQVHPVSLSLPSRTAKQAAMHHCHVFS